MKFWEVDVEVRVRKTLRLGGPETPELARQIIGEALRGGIDAAHFIKWKPNGPSGYPIPDETILEPDPGIVEVREVTEHD